MKIRMGDSILSPAGEPMAFVFKSDEERRWLGQQLLSIPDGQKAGKVFIIGPAEFNENREALIQFAKESYAMAEEAGQ